MLQVLSPGMVPWYVRILRVVGVFRVVRVVRGVEVVWMLFWMLGVSMQ